MKFVLMKFYLQNRADQELTFQAEKYLIERVRSIRNLGVDLLRLQKLAHVDEFAC